MDCLCQCNVRRILSVCTHGPSCWVFLHQLNMITPADQTSHLKSYGAPCNYTSGAAYEYVQPLFASLISQGCLSKQLLHVRRSHMAQRWWCQTQQKHLHKKHLCSTRRSPHTPHRACSHAVGGLQPCRRTWQQGWIHKFGGFRSRCIMRHFRRCPRPVHKSLDHATRSSSMIALKCSK